MAITSFADVITDQRLAEVLSNAYLRLAADRDTSFLAHPALLYGGDFAYTGTTSRRVTLLGLDGYDLPVQYAEGASIVPQAIADAQFSLTFARYGKAYAATDLVRFTDPFGVFSPAQFAADALKSWERLLASLVAVAGSGFSLSVTTSGTDLSIATFLAAITTLELGSHMAIGDGMAMCVLHTQQMADLRSAMALATSGAIQWNTPEDRYSINGVGFWIRLMGVDIFVSEHVPLVNAGADRGGSMWLPGGIVWCDMSVRADTADAIALGGKILFEQVRDAKAGTTEYVSQGYLGVTRGYDTAPHQLGVSINTDA